MALTRLLPRARLVVECLEDRTVYSASPVLDSTAFPYRAIGQVVTWFDVNHNHRQDPGEVFTGTAAMIGPHSALTSAHLVFDPTMGGFATSVDVLPGLNGGQPPLGTFPVRSWIINSLYPPSGAAGQDLAVLNFATPVGDITGFLNIRAYAASQLSHFVVNNIGYPGETHSGNEQFISSGLLVGVTPTTIRYRTVDIPVEHGISGSPLYAYILASGRRDIVGVHSRRIDDNQIGVAARITPMEAAFIHEAESATGSHGLIERV